MRQRLEQHPVLDAHRLALGAVDDDKWPALPAPDRLDLGRERKRAAAAAAQPCLAQLGQQWRGPAAA
jgi:hypothetical protein